LADSRATVDAAVPGASAELVIYHNGGLMARVDVVIGEFGEVHVTAQTEDQRLVDMTLTPGPGGEGYFC
jgi:hypothetical protein